MLSSDDDWQFVRHYFGAELDQSNFRDNQPQYRSIRVRFSEGYIGVDPVTQYHRQF